MPKALCRRMKDLHEDAMRMRPLYRRLQCLHGIRKQTMLDVGVGDTCSASTDGWTIATNSIGYLRRGAASHANPDAHAHARVKAQKVARTGFTSLRGMHAQRRAEARARCAAHADPRGTRGEGALRHLRHEAD